MRLKSHHFAQFVVCSLVLVAVSCETKKATPASTSPSVATTGKSTPAVERSPAGEPHSDVPMLTKLSLGDVDPERVEVSGKFVKKYMESCKVGQFEKLGDEATPEMRETLTPEKQKQGIKALTEKFGEYQSMEYVEAWQPTRDPDAAIFRFRGTYSRGEKTEIRVVLNDDDKVSGLWIKPWKDSLLPPKSIKLAEELVDAAHKETAEKLARDFLARQKAGEFTKLGDEAIPEMQEALSPEKQKQAWESIVARSGDYQSLEFVETWKVAGEKLTVFRFRGRFAREEPEIRVVLDEAGKLSGLWIKPWKDELN